MKLGIDFGTNRIVVAAADRGNYPLVSFEVPDGATPDWFPSLVALRGNERRYGWEAWDRQADNDWTPNGWTIVRSVKRLLESAGPTTLLDVGDQQINLTSLLDGLVAALHAALLETSNLRLGSNRNLEVVLGVPAHANNNQRFLTVDAFRKAGFAVPGVLNEPSAASIEFAHGERENKRTRQSLLVYDLGGGTFDASLVTLDDGVHHVVGSEGIGAIGGDDFDQILADLALDAAGIDAAQRNAISAASWFRLLEECRAKKEALNPNSRRISIDLEQANPAWDTVQLLVADFYEAARPLVEETIAAAEDLLAKHTEGPPEVLYVTGGGSELPLVARVLRERFGRRVRRSAYTRSATAIGLAIQAGQPGAYRLNERLARHFGVWREGEHGSSITFDPLFEKGTNLPSPGEPNLTVQRSYAPVHNLGHFRFLECSHRTDAGTPSGDIALWDEIHFPFDPGLTEQSDLSATTVTRSHAAASHQIEERYECDPNGSITVTLSNLSSGHSRLYQLARWSPDAASVKPPRVKKAGA